MKKNTLKANLTILLITILLPLFVFSQKKQKIKGDNIYATRVIALDSIINKILIRDDFDVSLSFMNHTNSVYISGDQNIIDTLNFEVVDGYLEIGSNFKFISKKKLKIELNISSVNELEIIEEAKINQIGSYTTDTFKLVCKGNAKIDFNIQSKYFEGDFLNNSSGNLDITSNVAKIIFDEDIDFKAKFKLQEAKIDLYKDAEVDVLGGYIENLKIRMVGAPILRAEKLRITELGITMENSSKAEVFCDKKIEVYLENKSKLELYGQPSVTIKAIKGSALLQKRE